MPDNVCYLAIFLSKTFAPFVKLNFAIIYQSNAMKTYNYLLFIFVLLTFERANAQNNTNAIDQVLQSYLNVEKSLVNDDGKLANKSANDLVVAIAKVDASQLDDSQKKAWTIYGEKLRYNSQHISESKSIDHQREHFAALSDEMYGLLKTFKTHTLVFRQYCPMKKQYWLNASREIQNPYYGKVMLDCGKVTETMTGTTPK
ncbi:MAG: DUF3347 domain-containing protein [Janthinobacterium lividum]